MSKILLRNGIVATAQSSARRIDVAIEDGMITATGENLPTPADWDTIDASDSIVLPGFVDTHRHMWQGALRGTAANDIFGEYFGRAIVGYAGRLTAEDVYVGTLLSALEAIDAGTTTVLDWAHAINTPAHADSAVRALRDSGIRAVFAYGPPGNDASGWWTNSSRSHPPDAERMRNEVLDDDTATVTMAMALRGPEFATIDVCRRDLSMARDLNLRSTMHIGIPGLYHQFDSVRALHEHGLLGSDITHVHANSYSDQDMQILADNGGALSFSPEVEMQMGFGWPPLRSALDAGLRPSLSVDVVTAVGGDLRMQARLLLQVGRALDNREFLINGQEPPSLTLSTGDAFEFATVQGARALGLDDRIGTVEVGKRADIILVRASDWNMAPLNDPVGQVILAAHPGNIHTVLINGEFVKRDGRLTTVTENAREGLLERAAASAARIR